MAPIRQEMPKLRARLEVLDLPAGLADEPVESAFSSTGPMS